MTHTQLLDAASGADRTGAQLARTGNRAIAAVSGAIAVLVALFLLAVVYVFPSDNPPLIIGSIVGYAIGIVTAVTIYNRTRSSTAFGATRRYLVGLSLTVGLFFVAVALTFLVDSTSPLLWVPVAVAVASPLVVSGLIGTRR